MGEWRMANFYQKQVEARNWRGFNFIMEGDGKFLKSLYIVDRGVQAQFIYEDPLYCIRPPLFFKFCPCTPPSPHSPHLAPIPYHLQTSPLLLFILSCFFGRMGDHTTFDVLLYLMILQIYTCQALVPQYQKGRDVCFMQQDINFTEV